MCSLRINTLMDNCFLGNEWETGYTQLVLSLGTISCNLTLGNVELSSGSAS